MKENYDPYVQWEKSKNKGKLRSSFPNRKMKELMLEAQSATRRRALWAELGDRDQHITTTGGLKL